MPSTSSLPWAVFHTTTTRPDSIARRCSPAAMSFHRNPPADRMTRLPKTFRLLFAASLLGLLGQRTARAAETRADLVRWDFAEERVVDLTIVKKVTGQRKILFLKTPRYSEYLEGFI